MAHVRIKRLCTRHGEHDSAKREEGAHRIGHEKLQRMARVERDEHMRAPGDLKRPEQSDRDEPCGHDWSEQAANGSRAATLDGEKRGHDRQASTAG